MSISNRIVQRMSELNLKSVDVAKKTKATKGTISQWRSGATTPSAGYIMDLCDILECTESWLLTGQESASSFDANKFIKSRSYPLLGKVSAGKFREAVEDNVDYIEATVRCTDKSFWLEVDGDSMTAPIGSERSFHRGIQILVDPNVEPNNGDFVVAYSDQSKQATFKQYVVDFDGYFLHPLNPSYNRIPITEDMSLAGVVVEARTKIK